MTNKQKTFNIDGKEVTLQVADQSSQLLDNDSWPEEYQAVFDCWRAYHKRVESITPINEFILYHLLKHQVEGTSAPIYS